MGSIALIRLRRDFLRYTGHVNAEAGASEIRFP